MDPIDTWFSAVVACLAIAPIWAACWAVPALRNRRNDIADVAWGPIFPVYAMLAGGIVAAPDWDAVPRVGLALGLSVIWALRLAIHIGRRAASHDEEDKRYAKMREQWGDAWRWRSVLQVFLMQSLIAVVIVQPLLVATVVTWRDAGLGWLDALAALLVVAGVLLEATADRQLERFMRRKRAGEVEGYLTTGVWAWSRHPNYAGDAITWWGFGLFGVAAALEVDEPLLIIPSLLGPLAMHLLLRYGSGVALSERGRSGADWDAYVARTSPFLPLPPRRAAGSSPEA